jgi:hypothetical protein
MALCEFRNVSGRMVILRCVGPEAFFQEKVIFPFEAWQWFCPPESRVDIWSHSLTGANLIESFPAEDVAISRDPDAMSCSREAVCRWTYAAKTGFASSGKNGSPVLITSTSEAMV